MQAAQTVNRRSVFSRFHAGWAGIYFAVLTVFMTWPLVLRMHDAVVGLIGDNVYFVWLIGWFQKALFQIHVSPFNIWFLNYPQGWSLSYTEITPVQILMALPVSLLAGPVFAYNFVLLLTFFLAGLGMYLWIRRLTGRTDAALLAGTAYAFLPFHFAHFLIGHLNLASIQWFPFYFWGLYDVLRGKKPSWKPAVMGGVALGLIALTSQYYLYMTLLLSAFLVLLDVLVFERTRIKDGAFWKRLAGMGAISLPLVAAGVAPFVSLLRQGGLPDRGLGAVEMYSASPTDFVLPFTGQFLWGKWIGEHFNREMWIEASLYIGLAVAALAVLAWIRRKESSHARLLVLMAWGALLAFVLALGTNLHWNAAAVTLNTPAFLQGFVHRADLPIPLPGYLLFKFMPLYAKMRVSMRFGVFVLIFACTAAGLGTAWLLARAKPRWQTPLAALLILLVLADFYNGPFKQFSPVQTAPAATWLASQPGKGAVAVFPFALEEDQSQVYDTLAYYGKPFVGGFFNAFPPPQYEALKPVMANFPDAGSVSKLRQLGVQWVLVDGSRYSNPAQIKAQCQALGLQFKVELDGQYVFELGG
jgi:hypothetical protein